MQDVVEFRHDNNVMRFRIKKTLEHDASKILDEKRIYIWRIYK